MLDFIVDGFPELTIRAIADLKKQLMLLMQQNEHLFDIVKQKKPNVVIELETKREFYFVLYQPEKHPGSGNYVIKFSAKPSQKNTLAGSTANVVPMRIIEEFKKWLELINSYEEALNILQNPFEEQTEKEINEIFNFLPEPGDETETFDIPTILMLEQVLDKTSEKVKEQADITNPEIQDLLGYIEEVKRDVPNAPRSIIKKKLSKAFTRIKKNAWPAFKWLLQETIKEVIKETLKGNIHLLPPLNAFQ